PYELGANWMFRINSSKGAAEYLKATRRWVLLRGIIPMYVVLAPLEFLFLRPGEALFQLAFGLAVSILLIECFFFQFNKVPFTCSYLPAKSHLAFLGGAYLYGFTIYTFTMESLEQWVGADIVRTALFFVWVLTLLTGISVCRRQLQGAEFEIVYEDDRDPVVRQLNIT